MKRKFLVLISALMLTGCGITDATRVGSVSAVVSDVEGMQVDFSVTDKYFKEMSSVTKENMEPKSFNVFDREIKADYKSTDRDFMLNYAVDIYYNENENIYVKVKENTDEILSVIDDNGIIDVDESTKESFMKSVNVIADKYIDTNKFKLVIDTTVSYKDGSKLKSRREKGLYIPKENEKISNCKVSYVYEMSGIDTMETFDINIREDKVVSFGYYMPKQFSENKAEIKISAKKVEKAVDDFVSANTKTSYTYGTMVIDKDDKGGYDVLCRLFFDSLENGEDAFSLVLVELKN